MWTAAKPLIVFFFTSLCHSHLPAAFLPVSQSTPTHICSCSNHPLCFHLPATEHHSFASLSLCLCTDTCFPVVYLSSVSGLIILCVFQPLPASYLLFSPGFFFQLNGFRPTSALTMFAWFRLKNKPVFCTLLGVAAEPLLLPPVVLIHICQAKASYRNYVCVRLNCKSTYYVILTPKDPKSIKWTKKVSYLLNH